MLITIILSLNMLLVSASPRIEDVRAEVSAEFFLPPMIKERMEESVAAIGNQLISGHTLPITDSWLKQQELTIHSVFDKILVGYTVSSTKIQIYDSVALIKVKLLPWSDTIQNIEVHTTVEGMPPGIEELAKKDLASINEVFFDGLYGLPIAATDWTNGILKRRLNKFMESNLPEFRADFDVKINNVVNDKITAMITLTVYPKLPVVRTVSLSMRSDTLPNVALVTHRTLMEDTVNVLVGVPVSFIERHKEDIQAMIAKPLDEQTDFRRLKMESNVSFTAAEQMNVMIRSDSKIYKMRATGWVDIGRGKSAKDDLVFRMHIGRKIADIDEAFFLIDVQPQEMKWNWALGYMRNCWSNTDISLRYDFSDKDFIAALEYKFLKNWQVRYEHKFNNDRKEAAIMYKLHDFLSVEYAVDDKDNWIRFIGNF